MQVKINEQWKELLQGEFDKPYFEKLEYVNNALSLDIEQKRIMDLRIKSYKDR